MEIGKFQPPTKSVPPNQSNKKFGTIDYVRDKTPTKFGTNPLSRCGYLIIAKEINKFFYSKI